MGNALIVTLFFYPIFLLLIAGKTEFLNKPFLTYFGAISYSLYLVHQNLGYIIFNYAYEYEYEVHPSIAFIFALGTSITLANFSTKYIEGVLGKKLKIKVSSYTK